MFTQFAQAVKTKGPHLLESAVAGAVGHVLAGVIEQRIEHRNNGVDKDFSNEIKKSTPPKLG